MRNMKNMIVVYGKCGGVATVATFVGNQWWITSRDERLEPLYSGEPYDQSDYRYLCQKDELILMKDIAGMMGSAMESGEADMKEVLRIRLKDLNAMGVKFLSVPQVLNLVVNVRVKQGNSSMGGYVVTCDDGDNDWMRFFELNGFASAKQAWEMVRIYIDFFQKHGVKVQARLQCKGEIMDELAGLTQGVKIEISDNL